LPRANGAGFINTLLRVSPWTRCFPYSSCLDIKHRLLREVKCYFSYVQMQFSTQLCWSSIFCCRCFSEIASSVFVCEVLMQMYHCVFMTDPSVFSSVIDSYYFRLRWWKLIWSLFYFTVLNILCWNASVSRVNVQWLEQIHKNLCCFYKHAFLIVDDGKLLL